MAATSARATEPVVAPPPGANGANGHHDESGSGRWTEASVAPQRRALATPAVRRLARELDIDIAVVRGSGPAGRVLAEDLTSRKSKVESRKSETAGVGIIDVEEEVAAPVATAPAPRITMPGDEEAGPAEERLPLRGLRKRIAENMVLSTSTMPQVTCFVEVDASGLVALRRAVKPAADAQGVAFSYLPFNRQSAGADAAPVSLHQWIDRRRQQRDRAQAPLPHRHRHGHAGRAAGAGAAPRRPPDRAGYRAGVGPTGRGGDARASWRSTSWRGSTFTISNFGAVGGYFATPLINPGEAAILGPGPHRGAPLGRGGPRGAAPDPAALLHRRPPSHRRRTRHALSGQPHPGPGEP